MQTKKEIHKGEIYMVNFGTREENKGSEQWGIRPAIIVQNEKGNMFSPTTIVVPITSRQSKAKLPTHVPLRKAYFEQMPNASDSIALAEVVRTVDKGRIVSKVLSKLSRMDMDKVEQAILVSFGL